MKEIRILKISIALAATCLAFSLNAGLEFKGKVVSLAVQKYAATSNAYDRGWINFTAKLGQVIKPEIVDEKGKVVVPGDVLIYGDPTAWEPFLKADKINVEASAKIKDLAIDVYKRYRTLVAQNAASRQNFTDAETTLHMAVGNYENYKEVLKQGQIAAKRFTIKAPFEGIVTAVSQGSGSDVGGAPAVEIMQLNPIGIQVQMPTNKQYKFDNKTPVKVYVNGVEKPVGAYHFTSLRGADSITFAAENFPVLKKNTILEKAKLPILRSWLPVVVFDCDHPRDRTLAVPVRSLQKDEKGSYVWRAKGQKVMRTDKGIDYSFPIEKVYIETGDQVRYSTAYSRLIKLKDNGGLEEFDLVLNNPPEGLKDGETAVYPESAYLLMPGDEVRVVVGN